MKEYPILFKPEMVRAILDGRKTQTRRVMKPQPDFFEPDAVWQFCKEGHGGRGWYVHTDEYPEEGSDFYRCPYGEVGDRLWVRETWQYYDWTEDGEPFIRYAADNQSVLRRPTEDWGERVEGIWESLSRTENYSIDSRARDRKWRPSLLMPRWVCRLVLEVTEIRVERVQDITEEEAKAEGVQFTDFGLQFLKGKASLDGGKTFHEFKPQQSPGFHVGSVSGPDECHHFARNSFGGLWQSIHKNDGYEWEKNPWVWVVSFTRMK